MPSGMKSGDWILEVQGTLCVQSTKRSSRDESGYLYPTDPPTSNLPTHGQHHLVWRAGRYIHIFKLNKLNNFALFE